MLFLPERPAVPAARHCLEAGEPARNAEALIAEARRRWLRGAAAVLVAAAGVTSRVLLSRPAPAHRTQGNISARQPTAAGACAPAVVYGSLLGTRGIPSAGPPPALRARVPCRDRRRALGSPLAERASHTLKRNSTTSPSCMT